MRSGPRPADAGRRHRGDDTLTCRRLVRDGVVIVTLVVVVAAVGTWGQQLQSTAAREVHDLKDVQTEMTEIDRLRESVRSASRGKTMYDVWPEEEQIANEERYDELLVTLTDTAAGLESLDLDGELGEAIDATVAAVREYVVVSEDLGRKMVNFRSTDPVLRPEVDASRVVYRGGYAGLQEATVAATDLIDAEVERTEAAAVDEARWMLLATIATAIAAIVGIGAIGRKMLRAVRTMNAMQDEMSRISSMVESSPASIVLADPAGVVRYLNPSARDALRDLGAHVGVTADDLLGAPISRLHPTIAATSSGEFELEVGPEVLAMSNAPITDVEGRPLGVMTTWSVVTEQRQMQRAAAAAAERERAETAELQRKVDSVLATLAAAAAGDLTAEVEVTGTDAIGQMGTALATLLADLRGSVASIATNSESLATAAESLQVGSVQMGANSAEASTQVDLVSHASNEVSRSIETVSAAAEEMSASIREIARTASDAAEIASQAVVAAQGTNDTVSKLAESSAEIGQIVKVITQIAQQTNLLALNATIEAARAGEAGKGFAVVANEVKELATETAKATEDISSKIDAIQSDTQSSIESIGGILTIIDQIAAFQATIASAVEQQSATTSEIARSVNEASRGTIEITTNLESVAHAAADTASGAADSRHAATQLAHMATDLQQLVGRFSY